MSDFIKAEKVVSAGLGLLERELTLPRLVWQDAAGDFSGAKGDTITIRLPAYVKAKRRAVRARTPITTGELHERAIDLTLDTHIYTPIHVWDDEMTLDIESFGEQVLSPVTASVAREYEDIVAEEIADAPYQTTLTMTDDPYATLVAARGALNRAFVPMGGRSLIVGSDMEAQILTSDKFQASALSDENALREAQIGRIAGFDVYTSPAIEPEVAVAMHRTAFAISAQAPVLPAGAGWGATDSYAGLAMRVLRDYDFQNVRDRLLADVYVGANHVSDFGHFDELGRFEPALDPEDPVTGDPDPLANDAERFVRAVRIELAA